MKPIPHLLPRSELTKNINACYRDPWTLGRFKAVARLIVCGDHLAIHATVRGGIPAEDEEREDLHHESDLFPAFATAALGFLLAFWGCWNVGSFMKGLASPSLRQLVFASISAVLGYCVWLYGVGLILGWYAGVLS